MTLPPPAPEVIVSIPPARVVRDPARLRWGTVSTMRAPLRDIARFAAYHLDMGAAEVHIFLDDPDPNVAGFLSRHPALFVTQCDDAYWAEKPRKARSTHQMRQAFNASRCYRRCRVDWLAHIDVDEFLIAPRPMAAMLAEAPADAALVRIRPAELLAQDDPFRGSAHFKLTRRELGHPKSVLGRIFPEFGAYVPDGFLSYTGGKNIARTGLPNIRLGLHGVFQGGVKVGNGHPMIQAHVGHAHAPSWDVFERHLSFRMSKGSYRRKNNETMALRDVLEVLLAEGTRDGLRRFYDEICQATPRLLAELDAHGMLLTAALDLDDKVTRWFGDLPDWAGGPTS